MSTPMQIYRSLEEIPPGLGPTVASIGNFDGLHRGHRAILAAARSEAQRLGARVAVVTFDPHPMQILKPEAAPETLTPTEEKLRLLEQAGADIAVVLPFSRAFSQLSAREFLQQVLAARLGTVSLHEGSNFRCGHRAEAGMDELQLLGAEMGFAVHAHAAVVVRRQEVSSSVIRARLREGNVNAARWMLGRCFSVHSHPARGRGIGSRQLAPTVNLAEYPGMLPRAGVYVTRLGVDGPTGMRWMEAVSNVGWRPTVDEPSFAVETHILDFEPMELTESTALELEFRHWLRPEIKWPDVASLKAQIARDVHRARRYFALAGRLEQRLE